MKRIGYLGPEGTVSHEAAKSFLGEHYQYMAHRLVWNIMADVSAKKLDYGVIPIENTIDGSVRLHVDSLVQKQSNLPIIAEFIYPSIQNLIGHGDELLGEAGGEVQYSRIRKIISIDVAIAQCRDFFHQFLADVEFEYASSTAEGVRYVRDNPGQGLAAVGTRQAASMYGLQVLADNITDHHNNYTRFVLIGREAPKLRQSDKWKTTILLTLPDDYPGALHEVLFTFAHRHINLSKIESRPTKLKLGSYYFYIDIEESMDSDKLRAAIKEIKEELACKVRILGSYPSYPYEIMEEAQS